MSPSLIKKIVAFASVFSFCASAIAMDADVLFDKISPSVWVVYTFDAQGKPFASGSAVVIGVERMITNCHVLAKASSFKVGNTNIMLPATLEFPDVERDLCQIKVSNLKAPVVKIAAEESLRVGQKVYAIGAPSRLENTLSDGLLSAFRRDKDGKLTFIQTSAPIGHGSSGGGLFSDKGELIGITQSGKDPNVAQNIGFALPALWIREVPERGKAALAKAGPASTASPTAASTPAPTTPAPQVAQGQQPPVTFLPPASTAPSPQAPSISNPPPVAALPVEKWYGLMSCDARQNQAKEHPAYQAKFQMDVTGSTVNVYRKNDRVVESLTGHIANNALALRGVGYLASSPDKLWQFRFNGEFPAGASIFSGTGNMLLSGNPIRTCDLTMTRI
jgi:S1-C subfamily serine protease